MQNYYKQFYPGYDFGNSAQQQYRQQMQQHLRHVPKSVVPLIQPTTQSGQQQQQPFAFPGFPSWPMMPHSQSQKNLPQFADYAAYYYQYYLGAMAAANGWPIPMGRTTPKVFIEPHIRATLSTPGMLIQVTVLMGLLSSSPLRNEMNGFFALDYRFFRIVRKRVNPVESSF